MTNMVGITIVFFNFEGGCYAKCIDLDEEKEPEIFHAIRPGALVEKCDVFDGTDEIDFAGKRLRKTRGVSYPLHFIGNAVKNEPCKTQKYFLPTCDAYGVLPPISKLSAGQAMYQFISGYTAKVAGTEEGVKEPKATFSACFGALSFLYIPANMQKCWVKNKDQNVKVWMINTGWIGGGYGVEPG